MCNDGAGVLDQSVQQMWGDFWQGLIPWGHIEFDLTNDSWGPVGFLNRDITLPYAKMINSIFLIARGSGGDGAPGGCRQWHSTRDYVDSCRGNSNRFHGLRAAASSEMTTPSTRSEMPVARSLARWMSVAPLVATPTRQPAARSSCKPSRTAGGHDTMAEMAVQYARHNSAVDIGSRYRMRIMSKVDGYTRSATMPRMYACSSSSRPCCAVNSVAQSMSVPWRSTRVLSRSKRTRRCTTCTLMKEDRTGNGRDVHADGPGGRPCSVPTFGHAVQR